MAGALEAPVATPATEANTMKMRNYITAAPTFHHKPIPTCKEANIGCDTRVLSALERSLENILEVTGFAHLLRYTVSLPGVSSTEGNKLFRQGQQEVVRLCQRRQLQPNYVAVKSKESKNQYDVAMFLDGRTDTQKDRKIVERADEIFKRKAELRGADAAQCSVQRFDIPETNILLYDKADIDNAFLEGSRIAQVEYEPTGRTLFASPRK